MTSIAKAPIAAANPPADALWTDAELGVIARLNTAMVQAGAHPARVLVLLPYGHLLPIASRFWLAAHPAGFAPRFETTRSWARALGEVTLATHDLRFDTALDSLNARSLLERSGLGAQQDELLPRLLSAAQALAPVAAAVPPAQRTAWGQRIGTALQGLAAGQGELAALRLESAVTQLALAWVASSGYASDLLWGEGLEQSPLDALDLLIVLDGLQPDPLSAAFAETMGARAVRLPLALPQVTVAHVNSYAAQDFEQEAMWAAACVLRQHSAAVARNDNRPVALVVNDRSLTRRIRALLERSGLGLRDDTGWTLSTSRAAATQMGLLRASARRASSDEVLDWLKNAPAFDAALVDRLEARLREQRCGRWAQRQPALRARKDETAPDEALQALDQQISTVLDGLQGTKSLRHWLAALASALQGAGQWQALQDDVAGQALLTALHLDAAAQQALGDWPLAERRLSASDFAAWVRQCLEAASYIPPAPAEVQVLILPLHQLLARSFAAVVMPGCDEAHLSAAPEPSGPWTAAERATLGLPDRDTLRASQLAAWQQALRAEHIDLLWRRSDAGGESLLPSALLLLQLQAQTGLAAVDALALSQPDPCAQREVAVQPCHPPLPRAQKLPVTRLSASAYEDLRRCPYRFFALRQLALREASELDDELAQRDIGDWLHEVLKDFHQALKTSPSDDLVVRRELLNQCADSARERRQLDAAAFLPHQAAWPALREGYLEWLTQHEATGARFDEAEAWHEMGLGPLTLIGRLDRIDRLASGPDAPLFLIDYKTESPTTTRERVKAPLEDTQLVFYAALLPHDSLRAAYVNLNEREGCKTVEHPDLDHSRDALVAGIQHDLERIADGATLAALGEGFACDYCAARGLCRKDFWEVA